MLKCYNQSWAASSVLGPLSVHSQGLNSSISTFLKKIMYFSCCNGCPKTLSNCLEKCLSSVVDVSYSSTFLGTITSFWCYLIVNYWNSWRVICDSFVEDNAHTRWYLAVVFWHPLIFLCYIVFTLEVSIDKLRMPVFIHLHMLGWICSLFWVDFVRPMCLCKWKWTSVCGKINFRGSYPCVKMNTVGKVSQAMGLSTVKTSCCTKRDVRDKNHEKTQFLIPL